MSLPEGRKLVSWNTALSFGTILALRYKRVEIELGVPKNLSLKLPHASIA